SEQPKIYLCICNQNFSSSYALKPSLCREKALWSAGNAIFPRCKASILEFAFASCDFLKCGFMDETVASKCALPEPPSRKVLHLRQCLNKFTNRLIGDTLSFSSIYTEFYVEIDKNRSKSEIESEHNRLINALKNNIKDQTSDLLDSDDVERRLNLLNSLIEKEKLDKTEKWRPSGKPDADLRPYKVETMNNFKRKLVDLSEPIEAESRSLKRKILDNRKSIIDKHKLIRDRLSKLRRK
uniref:Uncharacterized protein n=1 Tax=Romanomermis culicivorax TaxID=13658 RepID=A0A915HW01_ROMCU